MFSKKVITASIIAAGLALSAITPTAYADAGGSAQKTWHDSWIAYVQDCGGKDWWMFWTPAYD